MDDAMETTWAERAGDRVVQRFLERAKGLPLRAGGLVATARTSYRTRPLPPGFQVEVLDIDGVRRRLAFHPGEGRPILIVSGLYAELTEALFCALAARAAQTGRPVALLEDRFAASTLRLNCGEVPTMAQLGFEAASVGAWLDARPDVRSDRRPDVLALSAGVGAVLSAPAEAWERVAAFSGAVDPKATVNKIARNRLISWYYDRIHRRAWEEAGQNPPPWHWFIMHLLRDGRPPVGRVPLLMVHAENDPVTPVEAVRRLPLGPGQSLRVLPGGGHLGFGSLVGNGIYLLPLDDDRGASASRVHGAA